MREKDARMYDQRVLLSNVEVNEIGPNVVLENCDVHSDCESRALTITGLTMNGGRFIQQDRALIDCHFEFTHFDGVKFIGSFNGCTFGDWDDVGKSSITGCDFTEADLEDSRFLNCDVKTMRFPKWPSFTITNPSQARDVVLSRQWSPSVGIALDVYTDTDPECMAMCGDAARLAKRDDVPLDELRAQLQGLPGMMIVD